MTDFVHEPPKDPAKSPAPKEEKPTTEHERLKKVYTYVAVLFAVAFLLILWTFLMNQRSSEEMLHEIRSGNDAMQNILDENESLESHNAELENAVAVLEDELDALAAENDALREDIETQQAMLCALDWLRELEVQYAEKDYDAARETVRLIEDNGLAPYLSKPELHTSADGNDYISPAARYDALVNELFPSGVN